MQFKNKIVVVTGGASGIGKGLAVEAKARGAAHIMITDINEVEGKVAADDVSGTFMHLDVTDEAATATVIETIERDIGPIGAWFSNAGILFADAPGFECYAQSADQWDLVWQVNVHSHVKTARALLPLYKARGGGAFIITASAAGLLSQIGDAAYSTTKHAALGFAEAMAIAHGDDGVEVAVLCPQAVESKMLQGALKSSATLDGVLSAAEMAKRSFDQMEEGRFMIRPHPIVEDYFNAKSANYDRWIGGMRKLRRQQIETTGQPI